MSYKRRMLEGPHPLAGKLIFLPADIQFAQIDWHVSATVVRPPESKSKFPVGIRSRPASCCTRQRPASSEPGDDNSDRCPLPILGRLARRP
jgi:hypothetical protein